MLDYYGSVIKSETEIDSELVQRFRNAVQNAFLADNLSDCGDGLLLYILQQLYTRDATRS